MANNQKGSLLKGGGWKSGYQVALQVQEEVVNLFSMGTGGTPAESRQAPLTRGQLTETEHGGPKEKGPNC
jgi:hypothetical protein